MRKSKTTGRRRRLQGPALSEIERLGETLAAVDFGPLLGDLTAERVYSRGPRGWELDKLLRAYLSSYLLNLSHTSALVRRLRNDDDLRHLCGFRRRIPHRTTFSRFFSLLSERRELVEECLADLTDEMAEMLPGFGETVAVDSTTVKTHANPNRKTVKDPDATWTAKTASRTRSTDGKEWSFGYKYHLIADAKYHLPLFGFTTTASQNDGPVLPELLDEASDTHPWFSPDHVIADKGYDSRANHEAVIERGSNPIIAIRRPAKTLQRQFHEGVYAADGTPTCIGMEKMEYVLSDPEKGHLFRCRKDGCHLDERKGVLYCHDEEWVKDANPRLLGSIPRDTDQWKQLYRMRMAVERVFKSAKESLRLERHHLMGLKQVALHAALSFLSFQMTAMFHILMGQPERMRWMVTERVS